MQGIVTRKATAEDLADVKRWLERERRETGEGFFCNWGVIEAIYEEDMLDVLAIGSETVAFVADGRRGPDIVEVRPDLRGKGLGRRAAEHALQRAYDRGNAVVRIECAPHTSIPFWQTMGFTMLVDPDGVQRSAYAYKKLTRKFDMPSGEPISFAIRLYPEQREWNQGVEAIDELRGIGIKVAQTVRLPERAIFFNPQGDSQSRNVISVSVSGTSVFEGQVRQFEAQNLGVQRDQADNYYMDTITLP
ncbi:hypothetical protein ASD52_09695 [Ensifer sp. Root142]|uniref:GNAT family N-acetyltransferase n=1 Tax=Ensifer sp. Root142 TaxID=1736461 RepID=UPI00070F5CED|nr:GNAT family N-acetyltransferase [Ensifer sp. Root142]KQY66909.1 hypothetical protein ASD52_09695 [Ensifer sp. Root142]